MPGHPNIDDLLRIVLDLFARETGKDREFVGAETEFVVSSALKEAHQRGYDSGVMAKKEEAPAAPPKRSGRRRKVFETLPDFDPWKRDDDKDEREG